MFKGGNHPQAEEVAHSSLRLHREWKDGAWVPSRLQLVLERLGSITCLPFEVTGRLYREIRKEKYAYKGDKRFSPMEPQDPVGYAYNGLLTLSTQSIFREIEFRSRNNQKFVTGCNKLATCSHQNILATCALTLIGEPSPYTTHVTFTGAGGIYALCRFAVPSVVAIALKYNQMIEEAEAKKDKGFLQDLKVLQGILMKKQTEAMERLGKLERELTITKFRLSAMEILNGRKNIASMKINPADVESIVNELELEKNVVERRAQRGSGCGD